MQAQFRHDINGLRAFAVLLVILFHFQVGAFAGGFIGVDVFFVISGYLMTQIVILGIDQKEFNLSVFYKRRMARIMPALLGMAIIIVALGWLIFLPEQMLLLAKEAIYSLLFLVNFHYATDIGYFSPQAAQSWFLHCWSLAVEFQFYIILPLLVLIAHRVAGRRGVIGTLAIGALLSAALSFVQTTDHQTLAFYLLPTRFWEFVVGGLVMFVPPLPRGGTGLTLGGLMLIVGAGLSYHESIGYPALWPVLPVLGTAAVIYARSPTPLLANPVAQLLGTISYSLYLWHWPLLFVARYFGLQAGPVGITGLLAVTMLVAWMSYVFVETPFRDVLQRGSVIKTLVSAVTLTGLLSVCLFVVMDKGAPRRVPDNISTMMDHAQYNGDYRDGTCFLGPMEKAEQFAPYCLNPPNPEHKPSLMIWGDSHAAHLYPGIANRPWSSKYSVEELTASGCSPINILKNAVRPNCSNIQAFILQSILNKKPETVILSAGWGYERSLPLSVKQTEVDPQFSKLIDIISALKTGAFGTVVVVGPIPMWELPLPELFYRQRFRTGDQEPEWIAPRQVKLLYAFDSRMREIVQRAGGQYVSLVATLCRHELCRAYVTTDIGPSILQFDSEHLTAAGSDWIARNALAPILNQVDGRDEVKPGQTLEFKDGAPGTHYLVSGWKHPESWGSWSNGRDDKPGLLTLPVGVEELPTRLQISFWGQLGPGLPAETFRVQISGDPVILLHIDEKTPVVTTSLALGPGALAQARSTGSISFRVWAPDGKSPAEMGYNKDVRILGFGLSKIGLE